MRIGIVGYGTGGQHFHAPFIDAAEGVSIGGIVARSEGRVAAVKADFPDVPIFDSLSSMIVSGEVDAVTITTPPHTRRELVLEAIAAGLHVVADKPFAPDAASARELEVAAKEKGVVLAVFHNRRWDSDAQTLKNVLDSGKLGKVWRIHSRMDQDDPATLEHGPSGGLLRDLGSHIVDQMVWLFGPVASVDAQMNLSYPAEGETIAAFHMTMRHKSGEVSHVEASKINGMVAKEYRVYGEKGGFYVNSTDVQAQHIFAGKRPVNDRTGWGHEPESHWGTLTSSGTKETVPASKGAYFHYYEAFLDACQNGTAAPVTPADAIETLAVLDAAAISARENRVVQVELPPAL